ncbi:hypothetical protein Abr02nite_70120 [Paractinoplanes brasiliensis]|nr:hypothetical protein Abr02nite_70120 [Actinoplanes brasiliensis]
MVSQVCPRCGPGRLFDDDTGMCPTHIVPVEPYAGETTTGFEPEPDLEPEPMPQPEEDRSACWNCGTPVPHPGNTECLNPECRRSLTPPVLVVRFPTGQVELGRDARVELGRRGPHAALFGSYPNVSRHHAVVGTDPNGRAWIEPVPTPNGTFLDGIEIPASERRLLRPETRVRFALHAEGVVHVYSRQEARP